jgi:hypothetical protein
MDKQVSVILVLFNCESVLAYIIIQIEKELTKDEFLTISEKML